MAWSPPPDLIAGFEAYRTWLAGKTTEELVAELTRIDALLQSQQRATMTSLLSSPLSTYLGTLDRPVLRSGPTASPSPSPDRGRPPSPSLPPALSGPRWAPNGMRLARKLVESEGSTR